MGRKSKKAGKAFELDDPELPEWVEDGALTSGSYPYESDWVVRSMSRT